MVALAGILLASVGFLVGNDKCVGIELAVGLCATTLPAGEVWSKHSALHYREALLNVRDRAPKFVLPGHFEDLRLNLLQFYGSIRCSHVDERAACADAEVAITGANLNGNVERKFGAE